jgi:small subunit ribosomal protein S9
LSESENYVTSESSKSFAPLKTGKQGPSAGTGRRKEAIARVRIVPGNGKFVVNGKELAVYFPNKLHQQLVNDPFKVLGIEKNYDVVKQEHFA